MRNSLIVLGFVFMFNNLIGQTSDIVEKYNEVVVSIYSIADFNFGLDYKTSINSNTLLRMSVFNVGYIKNSREPGSAQMFSTSSSILSSSISFGIEKRKAVSENIILFTGIDITANETWQRITTDNPQLSEDMQTLDQLTISPGLSFKSGLYYKLNKDLFLGFSFNPHVYYAFGKIENMNSEIDKVKNTYFRFNVDDVNFSLIFKWSK